MSRGQSQPRTQSGRRTLERCKGKGKTENVIIDVDNGNFHIVDVPESSQQRLQGSKVTRKDKKNSPRSIISIDDDESGEDDNPPNGDEGGGDLGSDATSSKASRAASSQSQNSEEQDGNECQFIGERKFPMKLSKCKRTYSGKKLSRNYFGIKTFSKNSSSESDSSDCELMEGSSGKIREQWEKAALRKKMFGGVQNVESGLEDQASASGSNTDTQQNEVENTSEHHAETPVCSCSSNSNDEKEDLPTSTSTGDGIMGDPSFKPEGNGPVADLDKSDPSRCKTQSWDKAQFSHKKAGFQGRGKAFRGEPSFCDTETESNAGVNHGGSSFQDKEEQVYGRSFWSTRKEDDVQFNYARACHKDKEEKAPEEWYWFNPQSGHGTHFNHDRASFQDGEASLCHTQQLDETKVNHDETFSGTTRLQDETKVSQERASCQEKEKPLSKEQSLCNAQQDETQVNQGRACFKDEEEPVGPVLESLFNVQRQDEKSPLMHARDGDGTPDVQNDIIGEREKLKETDEYKRAAEEEWASRQRQLQIQAEEAKRLKKRKKAETLRLLDMERRLKQRLEEVRETKKKDEETINLKEQLRVEVRKELDNLEMKYIDMASLLRGLGIHVGGGLYPMPHEVHAAYKQALLRYHPDRASRTDIRQQVEAEEKFKLISRLKEKLLPTS